MSQEPATETTTKKKQSKRKNRWRVSRRGFLIGTGVVAGGLVLGWQFGVPEARRRLAGAFNGGSVPFDGDFTPAAWLEIMPDDAQNTHVRFYSPKSEMGQGIHTGLAQLVAEELELSWSQLEVVHASTERGFGSVMGTAGSYSLSSLYGPVREAAATLREMLRAEAAGQFGRAIDDVVAMEGEFFLKNDVSSKKSYTEVVAAKTGEWSVPEETPALKDRRDHQFIGRAMPRVDFLDKLTGKAQYGYDMRLPNMLYGAVARPPRLNASIASVNVNNAEALAGVVQVVLEDNFVGVVATSRPKAYAALDAIDISWEGGLTLSQDEINEIVTVQPRGGVEIQREGRVGRLLNSGIQVQAEYRSPFAAHAHLEPQAALADVKADKVSVYASTQFADNNRSDIAELLGRDVADIEVTAAYLGGGFGRKAGTEVALEAARLSNAVGQPVHVGWNRSEDLRHGYLRPPTHNVLQASLDSAGNVQAMEHQQASGDVSFGFLPGFFEPVLGADFGSWRGSFIHYGGIANRRAVAHRTELPLYTGWWRGLGLLANTFAIESFMDEVAHAAGADPLEFRLQHLSDDGDDARFKRVLEIAAERAGWNTPAPEGRARGVACCIDVGTVVAHVAEVGVENGKIRVHHMTSVVDAGLVVSPDIVTAQTQGSIVMGLSSTLLEAMSLKDGMYEASNFDRYPLLTIKDVPTMDVHLISEGEEPFGIGEPPIGPVAAAVANAVFTLTGQRLRELPLKLEV